METEQTEVVPTREDYMRHRVTHREYYAAVIKSAHIVLSSDHSIVRRCGRSTNEHYNDIPLQEWDWLAIGAKHALSKAFKKHGDFYTDGGAVCAMKEAARQAVERLEVGNV